MKRPSRKQAEEAIRTIIRYIGEDPKREGLLDTPARVVRSWERLYGGYKTSLAEVAKTDFSADGYDQMITLRGIEFWSACVPSNQLVNAVSGTKRAADVVVGDHLWTLKKGRVVETEVTTITVSQVRELVEVKTSSGTFRVTPDHPFATPDGWEEAQNLEGKLIEWTSARSLCRSRFEPRLGYSMGYAIGAMFSDGTVGDRYLSLVVNEQWFAGKFSAHLDQAFGTESEVEECSRPSGFTGKDTPGFRVRVVSSYLADLFRAWAGGDANHMRQHFPRVVLNSLETMQGFIDGYVDGDGSKRKDREASVIVSGNLEFLKELAEVIDSKFAPPKKRTVGQLYVSDRWHREGWFGKHGFRREDHETNLIESSYVEVFSVRRIEAEGKKPFTVYSFKCDKEPTFLIQGHLSHNCEHHMLTFYGSVTVGYIPGTAGRILGVSKLARIVEMYARRLQIQERMTQQIAEAVMKTVGASGVGVVVKAQHLCMVSRGVEKQRSWMITDALLGTFRSNEQTRAEFLRIADAG